MTSPIARSAADRLNLHCHCVAVERSRLDASLAQHLDDVELVGSLATTHRNLFSSSPVFVGAGHVHAMQSVIETLDRVASSPAFEEMVGRRLRAGGLELPRPRSPALLGIDFHLTDEGPKLIEVNTNPGGVLLALHLQGAQKACCEAVEKMERPLASAGEVEEALVEMARSSLVTAPHSQRPLIAIVDDHPAAQFLYPEFLLYRELFQRHGLDAEIADPGDLRFEAGSLFLGDRIVDGVYNRTTDFELAQPSAAALREAWSGGAIGVTPDPWAWGTHADKRNLVLLSDRDVLQGFGLGAEDLAVLDAHVPRTELVTEGSAEDLWNRRKTLFFKPVRGHGSRGAYAGRKMSRRKYEELLANLAVQPFVAQQLVPPSERTLRLDETELRLKLDVRCVVWKGRVLMLVARLYRGQATNMRTEGGGLATAFVA